MEMKKQIRKQSLKARRHIEAADRERKNNRITQLVTSQTTFQEADVIFSYMDCKGEVSTKAIMRIAKESGKKIAVPRVHGVTMDFYLIQSEEDLVKGYFDILEPDTEKCPVITPNQCDGDVLMIVPGVAFDRKRFRVGYGGGFYDRYLGEYKNIYKMAVAFEEQMFESVPTEETDQQMDCLITDGAIY